MDANGLVSNPQSVEGYEDKLSNLPEAVISYILSFLPTKDAVRTAILSTKWTCLWTTVTNLHIDDHMIYSQEGSGENANFMNFVDRVLLRVNPVIQSFHLSCSEEYDSSRVHAWISAVITRNVRKLDISYCNGEPSVFPPGLYGSDSLTELNLEMPWTFNVPTSTCFSSLKILQLSMVTFSNEHFSRSSELHFSFPLLEVLSSRGCKWQNVKVVNIDAPKLNSFTIDHPDRTSDLAVKIHGSCLKKFECNYALVDFVLPFPSPVIHATIQHSSVTLDQKLKLGLHTCILLLNFSISLKYLTLSSDATEALALIENFQDRLPKINNLTHLTISWATPTLGGMLSALLRRLPVLESLTFTGFASCTPGTAWFKSDEVQEEVPLCFQTCLKIVKLDYFGGVEFELELAKFLLKNAMILEEMTISAGGRLPFCSESEIEAVKNQLLEFPRGSDHATITFDKWRRYSWADQFDLERYEAAVAPDFV